MPVADGIQNIDPLILEFDKDLYVQEYCKTQFADIKIHIKIISYLRKIEKHFQRLLVNDEGDYWETKDKKKLQVQMDIIHNLIENKKKENPKMDGPFKMSNGRIFDLLTNEE